MLAGCSKEKEAAMIYGLDLEGFQSFGLKQELEFSPLTLIFGPNSVGKSSIGRALRLLSQSHRAGGGLRYSGDLVSLGGFTDTSHKRRTTDDAFIRIGLRMHNSDVRPQDSQRISTSSVEMVFSPEDSEKPAWLRIAGLIEFEGPEKETLTGGFTLVLSRLSDPDWNPDPVGRADVRPMGPLNNEARITNFVAKDLGHILNGVVGLKIDDTVDLLTVDDEFQLLGETGIERRRRNFRETFEDFRFIFTKPTAYRGLNVLPALRMPPRSQLSLLHTFVSRLVKDCAGNLNDSVAQFQYIGPLRNVSSEYVAPSNQWTKLVSDASNLQEHLTSLSTRELEFLSNAVEELTEGKYRLTTEEIPMHLVGIGGNRQVLLQDNFTKAKVTLGNAGTGISQVLPIVAGILSMSATVGEDSRPRRPFGDREARDMLGGLLFVEQPELHLHPAMQVRLADYLIDNSSDGLETNLDRGRGKPRIVCETHSEAILLRVISRIKAGELSKDKVGIYYVDRFPDWESSHAIRMEFDGHGNFRNPWPVSFSDIRSSERMNW